MCTDTCVYVPVSVSNNRRGEGREYYRGQKKGIDRPPPLGRQFAPDLRYSSIQSGDVTVPSEAPPTAGLVLLVSSFESSPPSLFLLPCLCLFYCFSSLPCYFSFSPPIPPPSNSPHLLFPFPLYISSFSPSFPSPLLSLPPCTCSS